MRVLKLTHERLLEALDYDPATGIFAWKIRPSNKVKIGMRAGVVGTNGYRFIMVSGEKLQASRLAWFYVHGEWPKGDIRFGDNDTDNCAITNLRDISKIEIARERKVLSNNTTGFRGVSIAKNGFKCAVTANYQQVNLGIFDTAEKASAVYEHAMAILAPAKTPEECEVALAKITQIRRKRVAWERLLRSGRRHEWNDLESFSADVGNMSDDEVTVAALDEGRPIGKENFRFLAKVAGDFDRSTKEGAAAYMKAYREANPGRFRHAHMKSNYGLDDIDIEAMRKSQNNRCLMCFEEETRLKVGGDKPRALSLDHNHDTKAPRALLCAQCNWAMGQFGDDLKRLRLAVTYLERFEPANNVIPFERSPAELDYVHATLGFGT